MARRAQHLRCSLSYVREAKCERERADVVELDGRRTSTILRTLTTILNESRHYALLGEQVRRLYAARTLPRF